MRCSDSLPTLTPAQGQEGTSNRLVLFVFASATFLGAFLLFLVQPLIAKYVLPWFGGGPAVWTTCMLFFQTVLLAGYAYAHGGARRLSTRAQAAVHVALLVAAVAVAAWFASSDAARARVGAVAPEGGAELAPVLRILLLLTMMVGVPAFVLSATSPLLNAWYARTAPAAGASVYRLYAVSNAGSLLALVAYPFVVEPALTRREQVVAWSAGVGLFAGLCGCCAVLAALGDEAEPQAAGRGRNPGTSPVPRAQRLLWLLLPACASVLLLATTNTMTHDVAAVPLLWVLPLGVYLLTFILAFDARRWYRRWVAGIPLTLAAAGVCAALLGVDLVLGFSIAGRVAMLAGALFVCCLVCHGELAALKPPAEKLTAYYLTIAAGGALGGVLVAVAAPLLLDRYFELHAGLWACCALALFTTFVSPSPTGRRVPVPLLLMLAVTGLVVLGAFLWSARDPYSHGATPLARHRDFYGVLAVYETDGNDPERATRLLRHGGVTHGRQFLSESKRRMATTYYGQGTGIGVVIGRTRHDPAREPEPRPTRVGVVGLGAGTLAAYGRRGDAYRFYELSPAVERFARERFTYLSDSAAQCDVVLGDARLSLAREAPQGFDLLVLDAFSGHAIPVHLLTAEAFDLYRRHLAPGGVIAVHVSNAYVDLQPVVARQAARGGWTALRVSNAVGDDLNAKEAADWIVLTDDAEWVKVIRGAGGVPPREDPDVPLWTDEYASVYDVLRTSE